MATLESILALKIQPILDSKFNKTIDNSATKMEKTFKKSTNNINSGFKKLGVTIGAVFSVVAVKNFIKSSWDAFKVQDSINTKLKASVQTVKAYNGSIALQEKAFKKLGETVKGIETKGIFGSEMLAGATELSSFQLSETSISKLMPKMADIIAKNKGFDAVESDFASLGNTLGKALNSGSYKALQGYGIVISEAEEKQLKLINGQARIDAFNKILGKSIGNVNEELAKTPTGQIKQLKNMFGSLKEEIGGQFAPVVLKIAETIKKNMPEIKTKISETINYTIELFGKISTKVKDLEKVFEKINNVIDLKRLGTVTLSVLAIGKAVAVVKGVIGLLSLALSPIVLVTGAIIGAGYLIHKNWDKLAPTFEMVKNKILEILPSMDTLKEIFEKIKIIGSDIFEKIKIKASDFFESIKKAMPTILEVGGKVFKVLGKIISTAFKILVPIIKGAIKIISTVISTIVSVVKTVFNYFKPIVTAAIDTMVAAFKVILPIVKPIFKAIGFVIKTAANILKTVFEAASFVIKPIFDGIKTVIGVAFDVISGLLVGFFGVWENTFNSIGEIGTKLKDVLAGVWTSISDKFNQYVKEPILKGVELIKKVISGVLDFFTNIGNKALNLLPDKLKKKLGLEDFKFDLNTQNELKVPKIEIPNINPIAFKMPEIAKGIMKNTMEAPQIKTPNINKNRDINPIAAQNKPIVTPTITKENQTVVNNIVNNFTDKKDDNKTSPVDITNKKSVEMNYELKVDINAHPSLDTTFMRDVKKAFTEISQSEMKKALRRQEVEMGLIGG